MRNGLVPCLFQKNYGGNNSLLPTEQKHLTIYNRHQIVIHELELGAVCTDFSKRTSWRARENPGRARTWKSMKNMHFSEMYISAKPKIDQNHLFLDETGAS
jgi:hypothetical protein